ncbi:MAG: NAD(P)/FAD-dependent oxidoreductase [Acidimicrobiia bacterium]
MYDVIVVGARVAGASTAMLLARKGYRVLLVDRAGPPADTLSTHALLRPAVIQLRRWGLLETIIEQGTPPIRKVTLGFADELVPVTLRPKAGVDELYAPRRTVLDTVLLQAAVEAGATTRMAHSVSELIRTASGRVTGVVLRTKDGEEEVPSRFVVGADGTRSRVAKLVGSEATASHEPLNAVIYAYFSELATTGYEWQFTPGVSAGFMPTNDGQVNVWVGYPASLERGDTEPRFWSMLALASEQLSERVRSANRASGFKSTPGLHCFLKEPGGPGWALVGDAGCTIDPIGAHGISAALRDAELCSLAVSRALHDPSEEAEALERYRQTRDELSLPLFQETEHLASYRWDAPTASTLLRRLASLAQTEAESLAP